MARTQRLPKKSQGSFQKRRFRALFNIETLTSSREGIKGGEGKRCQRDYQNGLWSFLIRNKVTGNSAPLRECRLAAGLEARHKDPFAKLKLCFSRHMPSEDSGIRCSQVWPAVFLRTASMAVWKNLWIGTVGLKWLILQLALSMWDLGRTSVEMFR